MFILSFIINVYVFVLILDVIFSYMPQYQYRPWRAQIRRASNFTCMPIRQLMPDALPLDFSPMIVIFLLKAIESFLLGI